VECLGRNIKKTITTGNEWNFWTIHKFISFPHGKIGKSDRGTVAVMVVPSLRATGSAVVSGSPRQRSIPWRCSGEWKWLENLWKQMGKPMEFGENQWKPDEFIHTDINTDGQMAVLNALLLGVRCYLHNQRLQQQPSEVFL